MMHQKAEAWQDAQNSKKRDEILPSMVFNGQNCGDCPIGNLESITHACH
jgi:hypothetical protein